MGTANMPFWMPAIGTHGIAQLAGMMPATSGTWIWRRPCCSGIDVVQHHAAVLAVVFLIDAAAVAHTGTLGVMEIRPLRVSSKLCLNSPRFSVLVTLCT